MLYIVLMVPLLVLLFPHSTCHLVDSPFSDRPIKYWVNYTCIYTMYIYIYTYPRKNHQYTPLFHLKSLWKLWCPKHLDQKLRPPLSITWVLIKRLKNHYFAWWSPKNNDSVRLSKTSIFHGEFTDFWRSSTDFYSDWWSPTSVSKPLPGDPRWPAEQDFGAQRSSTPRCLWV